MLNFNFGCIIPLYLTPFNQKAHDDEEDGTHVEYAAHDNDNSKPRVSLYNVELSTSCECVKTNDYNAKRDGRVKSV